MPSIDARQEISNECDRIKALLLDKNLRYGNSALEPVRIFSQADAVEQIKVRLDDKLSRILRGRDDLDDEDVDDDLIGYLVLLKIAKRLANGSIVQTNAISTPAS